MSSNWTKYMKCACGYREKPSFGDPRFVYQNTPVCPDCGTSSRNFEMAVERWVSTTRILRPLTWGSGFWETLDSDQTPSMPDRAERMTR